MLWCGVGVSSTEARIRLAFFSPFLSVFLEDFDVLFLIPILGNSAYHLTVNMSVNMSLISEKWLLIGHRGVGKSSFLDRFRSRFEHCIDLDAEIEIRSKQKISDIFEKYGEVHFRQVEAATFNKILEELSSATSVLIALGAGFKGHIWPLDYKCLWLRKESDIWPRYFKDRPAIATSSPEDFLMAYIEREKRYQSWADCGWTLPEGFGSLDLSAAESLWPLELSLPKSDAYLTLIPRLHRDPVAAVRLRKSWNLTFELRTDLWPAAVLQKIILELKDVPLLLSIRTPGFFESFTLEIPSNVQIDWDISLANKPESLKVNVFSLHDFSEGLKAALFKLEKFSLSYPEALLKASPIISSYSEMETLWKWREKDSTRRLVFPRTRATAEFAQWQWIRLLLKGKQAINFVREASEGPKDQPTLSQFTEHVEGESFAAVLGDPILHSYSPLFHKNFFSEKKMPFLAIPLSSGDLTAKTFEFLELLGASAYAVTSPLKENAVLKRLSDSEIKSEVFNTLFKKSDGRWYRDNTDEVSILRALKARALQSWRIWGSGAVAKQFYDHAVNAELYSARTGELKLQKGEVFENDFNLLWAASDEATQPPSAWNPQKVFDLSYLLRSHANLYAIEKKLDYENGLEFFKTQALAQQELWREL